MHEMFSNMTGEELLAYGTSNPKMSSTDRLAFNHTCNELVQAAQSLTPEQQTEVINELNGTESTEPTSQE